MTLNRKYPDNADGVNVKGREIGLPEELHGEHLIVASEPSTVCRWSAEVFHFDRTANSSQYNEDAWTLIGKNEFLLASSNGVFEINEAPYGFGWDAKD